MKYALVTASLLLASPAFAQDAQERGHVQVYRSIPAHAAVTATFAGGDAEILAAGTPNIAPTHQAVAGISGTPAGDGEVQNAIAWQNLVAKAGADRGTKSAVEFAAANGATATDAAQAPAAPAQAPHATATGRYGTMQDYWNDRS